MGGQPKSCDKPPEGTDGQTRTLHRIFERVRQARTARAQPRLQACGHFQRQSVAELKKQAGVNLETHRNQLDPSARTVRIDENHRGVVYAGENDTFILHKILTHDESNAWMARNRFKVNPQTSAVEVIDIEAIEAASLHAASTTDDAAGLLFQHRRDKDFRQLGIEGESCACSSGIQQ